MDDEDVAPFPHRLSGDASHLRTTTARADFTAFYREFNSRLIAFLLIQGVRWADACDIAQETMTCVFLKWSQIAHPKAYARQVAARLRMRRELRAEEPVAQVSEPATLCNVADWESRHVILQLIRDLPPRQRQVLAWTLDGYPPAEIARKLKMSPEAVRSNLYKARRSVAERLEQEGDNG
jgi:RNA polymerase sigma factor (sigma-70 family)